jgi:hypothetical protein
MIVSIRTNSIIIIITIYKLCKIRLINNLKIFNISMANRYPKVEVIPINLFIRNLTAGICKKYLHLNNKIIRFRSFLKICP